MNKQRGAALITALLITALLTTVAADLVFESWLSQRRFAAVVLDEQARQYALGGEAWVDDILRQDLQDSEHDNLNEAWATTIPPLPIEGGFITGALSDLQGRFNINSLLTSSDEIDPGAMEVFRRLLKVLELDETLASRVVDWLDSNTEPNFPDGAEDDTYTALQPPYRTASMRITDTSELLAIEGFDAPTYQRLAPHIVALPPATQLNLNTLSDAVFLSLGEDYDDLALQDYLEERVDNPYQDTSRLTRPVSPEVQALLTTKSRFFGLTIHVALGERQVNLYSILERDTNGRVTPRVRRWMPIRSAS